MGCVSSHETNSSLTSNNPQPTTAPTLTRSSSSVTQSQSTASRFSRRQPNTPTTTATTPIDLSSIQTLHPPFPFQSSHAPPPLLPGSPQSTTIPCRWSRSQLTRERLIFFETRVTGHVELWQAVRLAVELGRDGGDWNGAQSVLEAAGCKAVQVRERRDEMCGDSGIRLWGERGEEYRCPIWVWADPEDVVEDEGEGGEDDVGTEVEGDGEEKEGLPGDNGDVIGGKEGTGIEKGKEKEVGLPIVGKAEGIKVRARLSDRGTDVVVLVSKEWRVEFVLRRICENADLSRGGTKIKLAYMGRMLDESQTLAAQGWQAGHVVNALVFQ